MNVIRLVGLRPEPLFGVSAIRRLSGVKEEGMKKEAIILKLVNDGYTDNALTVAKAIAEAKRNGANRR